MEVVKFFSAKGGPIGRIMNTKFGLLTHRPSGEISRTDFFRYLHMTVASVM